MKFEHWFLAIAIFAALAANSVWSSLTGLWEGIGLPMLLLFASVALQSSAWVLSATFGGRWIVKLLLVLVVFGRCHR
jgi:hypothetical protein